MTGSRVPVAAGLMIIALAPGTWACSGSPEPATRPDPAPRLTPQSSGTTVLLQAVSPVSGTVVWVSGHGGTVAITTDGGASWHARVVPGADTLQFRDVHGIDRSTAYLLSAGPGEMSRIYKTRDGGDSWELQWVNEEPEGFYDCFDFWDERRGVAYGDAVDGELRILLTVDGGLNWTRVPGEKLPAAQTGEGGFAASGTCVRVWEGGHAWIATGNAERARVLISDDWGRTWTAVETPLIGGEAAGSTTITFRDRLNGLVMGGALANTKGHTDNVAVSADGGHTWVLAGRPRMAGAAYGATFVPRSPSPTVIAVGPGGADYSIDNGRSWASLHDESYWGIAAAESGAAWLVGPEGRITKVSIWP
jgi:photosystem II stability/assembly factor-like uncharacterized protein